MNQTMQDNENPNQDSKNQASPILRNRFCNAIHIVNGKSDQRTLAKITTSPEEDNIGLQSFQQIGFEGSEGRGIHSGLFNEVIFNGTVMLTDIR